MKTKIILTYFFYLSSLLSMDNNWNLTLSNGDTISNISLNRLEGDSLVISDGAFTKRVLVDSIVEVRQINKSNFREGAGIGLLAGMTIGALMGRASYKKPVPSSGESKDWIHFDVGSGPDGAELSTIGGGLLGCVSGFIIGGIIGASSRGDERYDLLHKNHYQKINMIQTILLNE
jgi:hypothetical protein